MSSITDIYVVDNLSTDDSVTQMREWMTDCRNIEDPSFSRPYIFKDIGMLPGGEPEDDWSNPPDGGGHLMLIRSAFNGGYAYGNNIGLRLALSGGYDYFWILNNDTEVARDALYWLQQRIESDPEIDVCGSKLIYHARRDLVQAYGGASFSRTRGLSTAIGAGSAFEADVDEAAVEAVLSFVNGASTLVTRNFLNRVGLMEESYFLYWEELDWALRRPAGMKLGFAKRSVVYHKVGASIGTNDFDESTPFVDFLYVRNRILVCLRHSKISTPYALLSTFHGMLKWLRRGKPDRVAVIAKAIWSAFVIFTSDIIRSKKQVIFPSELNR